MLLRPGLGEGICDNVPQALAFTKQHLLLFRYRADGKPESYYLAFTETICEAELLKIVFWVVAVVFGFHCNHCQRIGKEIK